MFEALNMRAKGLQMASRLLDRRGSIAVWFSLSLPVIMMFGGAAMDYAQQTAYQRALQAATDAAALAAVSAPAGSDSDTLAATVNQYISNNFVAPPGYSATSNVSVNSSTGIVTVQSSTTMNTMIMSLFGFPTLPVDASAGAARGATGPTEVAIVFDTTYSMSTITSNGLSRLQNAQADAVALVNTLMTQNGSGPNPNVKVGLVPFGLYVNISSAAEQSLMAQGMSQTQAWAALTTKTTSNSDTQQYNIGAYNPLSWLVNTNTNITTGSFEQPTYGPDVCGPTHWVTATCSNDGVPYDCSYWAAACVPGPYLGLVKHTEWWGYSWAGCVSTTPNNGDLTDTISPSNPVYGLLGYTCASPMQRLTTDKASLISQINALVPYDNTYIPEGLVWGWRVLSPNAPFADAAPYNSKTKKILILMTDGYNTNEPDPSLKYPDDTSWPQFGPGEYYNDWGNDGTADATTQQLCASIQAVGVTIYTIPFMVSDPNIKSILQNCASAPANYFDAGDITSLQAAFTNIGNQLTSAHLVQ